MIVGSARTDPPSIQDDLDVPERKSYILSQGDYVPFEKAISVLRNLSGATTPIEKLQCVGRASTEICKGVQDFWHGSEKYNADKLMM